MVTKGFRDVLFIARQDRPKLHDFFMERSVPPVKRRFIFEVPERIGSDGKIIRELDEQMIEDICLNVKKKGIAS
ncbi:MAG: hydantoinase/oxoprolinase N-terminal domain-containing protein, partial [Desulfatiglandales bacterium]|nr:hydantoinase/oxoprolinase N-terminal domain-containing protein [Desulfatiglandales bacterium]